MTEFAVGDKITLHGTVQEVLGNDVYIVTMDDTLPNDLSAIFGKAPRLQVRGTQLVRSEPEDTP